MFDEAYDICKGTGAENALDYLHTIYKELPCLNSATSLSSTSDLFRETITIRESYFQGIINGIGDAVIWEEDMTSFSANLTLLWVRQALRLIQNAITMKHLSDDDVNYSDNPDVLVFAENGHEMKALRYVDELNEKGINAQFSVLETLEETEQFAKSRGIAKVESI